MIGNTLVTSFGLNFVGSAGASPALTALGLPSNPLLLVTNNSTVLTLGGTFSGNGGGLTNLNASQLVSGTVPLAQLPSTVVTNTATGLTLGGTFSGSGGGLTNLNASQLASGTVPLAQLPSAVVTNNGMATVSSVIYGVANLGAVTNNASVTINTASSALQTLAMTAPSGSGTKNVTLSLTGMAAGQNVTVVISRLDSNGFMTYNVILPSGTTIAVPVGKSLLVNFICLGSTLAKTVISASVSQ